MDLDTDRSPTALRTTARGTAALGTLWTRLGLPPDEPEVLANRGSLMVRLPRAGVVARVSTHTGAQRRAPGLWLTTEVAVGRVAHAAGAPVVAPADHLGIDAGPHEVDGLWMSLWTDVGGGGGVRPGPEETGAALAAWHAALDGAGSDLPQLPAGRELITEALHHSRRGGVLSAREHAALTHEHLDALEQTVGRGTDDVVLHGDAHRGNLLRDRDGRWVWNDLEESCRGPVEWDLAVLSRSPTPDLGAQALRAYCRASGRPEPSAEELAPWLRLRELEAGAWTLGCAVTFPERYAAPARAFVERVLGRA